MDCQSSLQFMIKYITAQICAKNQPILQGVKILWHQMTHNLHKCLSEPWFSYSFFTDLMKKAGVAPPKKGDPPAFVQLLSNVVSQPWNLCLGMQ
mgnify:FL=1